MLVRIVRVIKRSLQNGRKYSVDAVQTEQNNKKEFHCLQFIDESFKNLFRRLGILIGKNPWWFMIVPIIISTILGIGLCTFVYENDPVHLFGPISGQGNTEQNVIEQYFPLNATGRFTPLRVTRLTGFMRIFTTARDGGNLLRSDIWQEIKKVDQLVRNTTVFLDGQVFTYKDLCSHWEGQCFENDILNLADMMDEIEDGNRTLAYPFMLDLTSLRPFYFPFIFGGIELTNNESSISSVKSTMLLYIVNFEDPLNAQRGLAWENAVFKILDEAADSMDHIRVDRFSYSSFRNELDTSIIFRGFPLVLTTTPLLVLFVMGSMSSTNWVRAKPWLGVVGFLTVFYGSLGAYGIVCYMGTPVVSLLLAGYFMNTGIGLDDGFVMLAAWRKTRVTDSVPVRLGEAYAEAAMSITITSLTDMFSFWVGVTTPFHSVRIFCLYTGAAVVGTYICHVTMFGAGLALSGYHEEKNRHGLFFWRTVPIDSILDDSSTDGKIISSSELTIPTRENVIKPDNNYSSLMDYPELSSLVFFRDTWAFYINKPFTKVLVILSFFLYIAVAGWGISQTKEEFGLRQLALLGSKSEEYFEIEDTYFRAYPYRIQVIVTGDLDYSNKTVQAKIEKMMIELEGTKFIGPILSESWLRNFLRFTSRLQSVDIVLDLSTQEKFIKALKDNYLDPASITAEDVKFSEDGTKIVAARFFVHTNNILNSKEETQMVQCLRGIADSYHSVGLNVTLFNPYFMFFDISLEIRRTTIQCVAVTCVIMIAISLLLIPNPVCSVWVALSIMSIEAGVLGLLVLWNVNLDCVSMLSLIICIGFSVDFSAHISYAYVSSEGESPEEKVRESLYSLGMPIFQGALSTVMCVLPLFYAPSYILTTFAKAIVLVMTIAAAHGLIILPVMLSIFGPGVRRKRKNGEERFEVEGKKYEQNFELSS